MTEEQSRNYTHVLLENLQTEIRELRLDMKHGFEADIEQDRIIEDRINVQIKAQDSRVQLVERMCWVSLGGMIVIGGIVGIYGQKILHLLAT